MQIDPLALTLLIIDQQTVFTVETVEDDLFADLMFLEQLFSSQEPQQPTIQDPLAVHQPFPYPTLPFQEHIPVLPAPVQLEGVRNSIGMGMDIHGILTGVDDLKCAVNIDSTEEPKEGLSIDFLEMDIEQELTRTLGVLVKQDQVIDQGQESSVEFNDFDQSMIHGSFEVLLQQTYQNIAIPSVEVPLPQMDQLYKIQDFVPGTTDLYLSDLEDERDMNDTMLDMSREEFESALEDMNIRFSRARFSRMNDKREEVHRIVEGKLQNLKMALMQRINSIKSIEPRYQYVSRELQLKYSKLKRAIKCSTESKFQEFVLKNARTERRSSFPDHARDVLRQWFLDHRLHPFPNEEQKYQLSMRTGLTNKQVSTWFINQRSRTKNRK